MDDHTEVSAPTETLDNCRSQLLAAILDAHHTTFYTVISVIYSCIYQRRGQCPP